MKTWGRVSRRLLLISGSAAAAVIVGSACSSADTPAEQVGVVSSAVGSGVNWLTRSFDTNRSSSNASEFVLNRGNVNWNNTFGKLFDMSVDDAVWAQILYASVPWGSYQRSIIFVATASNSLYAFDTVTGAQFWPHLNFGTPVHWDKLGLGTCTDFAPPGSPNYGKGCPSGNVGIIGTPVISASTNQLYLVAHTWESGAAVYHLCQVDITNGTVTKNIIIPQPGTDQSWASISNQRAGLALSPDGTTVYVAFAGYCDQAVYHGWVMGFSATGLNPTHNFNTTNTSTGSKGGVWQSGQAPALDSSGNLYVATGNGDWDGVNNFGQTVLKLSPSLSMLSYFTPGDWSCCNGGYDLDLGVTGPTLLPGTTRLVQGSKEGKVYLLDQGTLGAISNDCPQNDCCAGQNPPSGCNVCWNGNYHFDRQVDQVVQADPNLNPVPPAPNPYYGSGQSLHLHSGTPVWTGPNGLNLYTWAENDQLRQFTYNSSTGQFAAAHVANALPPGSGVAQGGSMSISSYGAAQNATGIMWATSPLYPNGVGHGVMYALNAEDMSMLWASSQFASDDLLTGAKWNPPTIASGQVFAATFSNTVSAYGLRGKARVAAYWDGTTQYVLYPDTIGELKALGCRSGGCWTQQTTAPQGSVNGASPLSAFSDGSTGHLFFQGGSCIGEMDGSPPSQTPTTWVCYAVGSSYYAVPEAHASFWDGYAQHIYFVSENQIAGNSIGANGGAGKLHEIDKHAGTWTDSILPQCPYGEFGNGPRYVTAYWDGAVYHVISDCVYDVPPGPYPHELWETYYYNGAWGTHLIASTANGGSTPTGYFSGASANGTQAVLGLGPPGTNTVIFTSAGAQWSSVPITVPSVGYNSTFLVYPDSTGLRYFFVGLNGHVYSIQNPGPAPTIVDLASTPGQSSLASSSSGNVAWTSDLAGYTDGGNDHVFFVGADGYVHEFYGGKSAPYSSWFEHQIGSGGAYLP